MVQDRNGNRSRNHFEWENRKLRREIATLRREKVPAEKPPAEKPKSLRRIFLEFLAGGGIITAAIGGGYIGLDGGDSGSCASAHAAIRDDRLNQDLSEKQRKDYMNREYRIAEKCDRDNK